MEIICIINRRMLPTWLRLSHPTSLGGLPALTFPWTEDQNYGSNETGE
jgi:hypothetical protein